ncbi:MAG TPA: tyrosine-type recombinase/integrase [Solirubrobacterales bacterium]|nr:tyrosine-type recombinase/integrase [Solirubrobacterales bacterium]
MTAKKPVAMVSRAKEYLAYRRSLGFDLETSALVLLDFARFADRAGHRGPLTSALVLRWATQSSEHSLRYHSERLSIARGFARYLAARDAKTEIPDQRLLAGRFGRSQPHVYTDEQLGQLVSDTAKAAAIDPLRRHTYATVFGLLASTGLRVSEALGLELTDVDLERGVLHVRRTKFRKSRLVPMHPSVTRAMGRYRGRRDQDPGCRESAWFFAGRHGRPLPYTSVRGAFLRLRTRLGWRSNGALPVPRIHDLRHTFACRRLLAWYREDVDVERGIVALSTYLGHGKVTDTYWYLTGTSELLAIAGDRFERFVATGSAS